MKKSLLIGSFFIVHIFGCISPSFSQRSPQALLKQIQKSKADTGRIRLFLEMAMSYVLRTGNLRSDMDSARLFVSNALQLNSAIRSIEGEGKCYFVYSNIFREEGNNKEGKNYAQKAIGVLSKTNKKNDLANSYLELDRYYDPYIDNELTEKIRLNERAAQLLGEGGNREALANTIKFLGDLFIISGNYQKALIHLKDALKIFTEIKYKELQGLYDLICNACRQMGDYPQALKYGLLALKTAEMQKDSSAQLSAIYNHVGATLYYLNKPAEAAQYYEKGVSVTLRNRDSSATVIIVHNLANAYTHADEAPKAIKLLKSIETKFPLNALYDKVAIYTSLLSAYTEMKKKDSAKIYFNKLLDISSKRDLTDPIQSDIYSSFIKYFIAVNQYADVARYCSYNELLCQKFGFVNRLMATNYRYWYKADSALGHFDSALTHYQKMVALNDTLFNEAKARQISELQIQYETEKKDDNIQELTKQDQLQKKELRQATVLRNVTLAAVALLIIVLLLVYNRFRLKQKANHQLEIKQREINNKNKELEDMLAEKEWWLKEVHHRVKNNLHTIICLLESQAMYLEKDALQAIEKSQHRIYAMSLIHQKLYQNEDVKSIDMSVYLNEFIQYLKDSFDVDRIKFVTEVEPIQLNLSQAIPVGLIINEAVTNSIKYAFTDPVEARIFVFMNETAGIVNLTIADNGKGFIPTDEAETKSLGLQLIKGLSKEIRGNLSIKGDNGTKVAIQFKRDIISSTEQVMQKELMGYEA